MKLFKNHNYQNILLVFLWLSGFLKGLLTDSQFEIDVVIIVVYLTLVDIIFQISTRKVIFTKYSSQLFFVIILFYLWIIFSLNYSNSMEYKYEKALKFSTNILFFIYPLFIKKIKFDFIINTYSIVLIPLGTILVYLKSITWSGSHESVELFIGYWFDYLALGFHLGVLFLLLNYFKKQLWLQIITFGLLFASSARGPFLFTIVVFIIINFNQLISFRRINYNIISKLVILGILITYFLFDYLKPLLETSIARFDSLGSGIDESSINRLVMMKFAIYQPLDSFSTFIFGNGIGSFGFLLNGIDGRAYPHNIFLEIFFELGILGLFLFFLIILIVWKRFSIKNNVFFALLLFCLLETMKSSNLTDLWVPFSFLGGICVRFSSFDISK